ncbi:MAG: Cobalamin biosynthesis protein, partial [Pelotomaculum thermopropionicum]
MTEPIIAARQVEYTYPDGAKALNDLSLEINKGQKIALLGANGAGKSTLLLHFNGILRPQRGKILFCGKELHYRSRALLELRKNVGLVFQDPDNQLFSASVLQDVAFGPLNIGWTREAALAKARAAMRETQVADLEKKPTHFLSYGQKKRVAIAGVLAMEPQVVIVDEPTAGLDPRIAHQIMSLLYTLSAQGKTLIISTHDVDLAYSWADYVFLIRRGQIAGRGEPRKVFLQPELLARCDLKSPWVVEVYRQLVKSGVFHEATPVPGSKTELLDLIGAVSESNKSVRSEKNGRRWRRGFTTGSCAAAAAKGAAVMLAGGKVCDRVSLRIPTGTELNLDLHDRELNLRSACCSVIKDAGDDPDVTDGIKVFARVSWKKTGGIEIAAGEGIGVVSKPGLSVGVGMPAINPVPRQMIIDGVASVIPPGKGARVEIWIPGGAKLAQRTLNPRLGIKEGISVLGTTGIVEPMSEEAFKNSLVPQIKMALAQGEEVLVFTPGRIGQKQALGLGIPEAATVQMSNFVGFMLEQAAALGVKKVLLLGHLGKLAKVAAGVFHTHSKIADVRLEPLITEAALDGVDRQVTARLFRCVTAEETVTLL